MKKNYFLLCCLLSFHLFSVNAQSNFIGSGIALRFNGASDKYADLGDAYNDLQFPFTFESWISPSSYPPENGGGIFASDNDLTAYYGFWIKIQPDGTLAAESGDGLGAGYQNRQGVLTTQTIPIGYWTHIAVTFLSTTDIKVYFNGVLESTVPTNGTAQNTEILHTAASASLGRYLNPNVIQNFIGVLDEARLWNIERSKKDLRDFMCKKVDVGTPGLIGYWKADESYTSTMLEDYSSSGINGTLIGNVNRITSGAPLGDESNYNYSISSPSSLVTLPNDATGDVVSVGNIKNNPEGVQVYMVNSMPYDTVGLNEIPNYYYGVFCANGATAAVYKLRYSYTPGMGIITEQNKGIAELRSRNDGSEMSWVSKQNSGNDTAKNVFRKHSQFLRGEYILNIPESAGKGISKISESNHLLLYPNPAIDQLYINFGNTTSSVSKIIIRDLSQKEILTLTPQNGVAPASLDVSALHSGIYFVEVISSSGRMVGKFSINR